MANTYRVVKLKDDVLVYDIDSPDDKQEFMDSIGAKPGDVYRFSYNGWLEKIGNDFDDKLDDIAIDHEARKLLTQITRGG